MLTKHKYNDGTVRYICTCVTIVIVASITGICVALNKVFNSL